MSEFTNRIKAQRELLRIVNSKIASDEELFGLSEPAINRWLSVCNIKNSAKIAELLISASGKLYFLANKSQEQVTEDYKMLINEFRQIAQSIEIEIGILVSSSCHPA